MSSNKKKSDSLLIFSMVKLPIIYIMSNRRRRDRRKDSRRLSDKIDNLIYRIGIFFLRGHYA